MFNSSSEEIVELLDGSRTLVEISDLVSNRHGVPIEDCKKHVDNCLGQLRNSNLLEDFPAHPAPAPPVSLSHVGLEITNACNLRCIHCYAEGGVPTEEELTAKEIYSVLDQVSEFAHVRLRISGGEPTLRRDFKSIVRRSPRKRLSILTNGKQLDSETVEEIKKSGADVQVSLDGPDEESHEYVRGPGTFKTTVQNIRILVERLSGDRVTVSMCPMQHNSHLLRPFVDLALDLGVKHIHFPNLVRLGRAREVWEKLHPSAEKLSSFYEELYMLARSGGAVGNALLEGLNVLIGKLFSYPEKTETPCPVGETINIASDGGIYPCSALVDSRFLLGNVRGTRLSDVPSLPKCQELREISRSRVDKVTECKACEWRCYCGAGCMGLALMNEGSFFQPDPLCLFRKRMYADILFDYADGELSSETVREMQGWSRKPKDSPTIA